MTRVQSKDGTAIAFDRSGSGPAGLRHAVQATGAVVPGAERRFLKGQTHN